MQTSPRFRAFSHYNTPNTINQTSNIDWLPPTNSLKPISKPATTMLSEYELQRQARIAANKARMELLGVQQVKYCKCLLDQLQWGID